MHRWRDVHVRIMEYARQRKLVTNVSRFEIVSSIRLQLPHVQVWPQVQESLPQVLPLLEF